MKKQDLIEKNIKYLEDLQYKDIDTKNAKKIADSLNKDKLVTISGLKYSGKTGIIKYILEKSGNLDRSFYFNKTLDNFNLIKSSKELENLINVIDIDNKYLKIIVLENINKIKGIKDFISEYYKKGYKIIIIGNTIKIGGIDDFEIYPRNILNLNDNIKYGKINFLLSILNINIRKNLLKMYFNELLLEEIKNNFLVRDLDLYVLLLSFLSANDKLLSQNDITKEIKKFDKTTVKTIIEYIDYSINAKILKKCFMYDFKKDKAISSSAKYYFGDNSIRNYLTDFKLPEILLKKNLVFNSLESSGYQVFTGKNGSFYFDFYAVNGDSKIFIHFSESEEKNEIKKEINKLNKIDDCNKKYLVLENHKPIGLRKTKYENLVIVDFEKLIKKELN